jgi:hypothetical protein
MGANWLKEAAMRLAAFALSLLCGIVVPLSTLPAEAWVRGEIDGVPWFSAGVTYVAGIGLVSNSKAGLIVMLVGAGVLAFVYGVDMKGVFDLAQANPGKLPVPLNAVVAKVAIAVASLLYVVERVGRHLINDQPFPE